MATKHTNPIIIAKGLSATTVSAAHKVGLLIDLDDGGKAVYANTLEAITQFSGVVFNALWQASMLTTDNVADGAISKQVGWAIVSVATSSYGWFQLSGRPKGKLASACADAVILFTTGTDGVLDDVTVSAALIAGVTSKTTISNATAVTLIVQHGGAYVHPYANPD